MKFFTTILLIAFQLSNFISFAQVSKEEMENAVNIKELQHPYLYFSDKEKPEILERIKNDPHCKKVMEVILAEGHRFLKMPFKAQDLVEPKHPRYSVMEKPLITFLRN